MSTLTRDKQLKPEIAANLRLCHRRSWPCWLTAEEVAEMLRVDIGTVYSLARQNVLPHVKIGRIYRFDRDGMFWQARESYRENRGA
ncbi:MAG: helix-turn-helix domain-containing protein [Syntrophomonadaceae bacterium]|nr:helix-turn-helix domain-containing protein [Syntrophomonadaceae bacterium]